MSTVDVPGATPTVEADSGHAAEMVQLANATFLAQALYVAAELGLADLVAEGARNPSDLAKATGAHEPSLYRLLRMLAGHGVFREDERGRFALTPLAATLRAGSPISVRDWVRCVCLPASWASWGNLLHSVRTGEAAFEHVHGVALYDFLATDPDLAAAFGGWMTKQSELHNAAILSSYDFSRFRTVVDVGGGRGSTLAAILRAHPAVRGVLLDRPEVVAQALPALTADLADRCEVVGGDALRSVPAGGDCYLVKRVLMGEPDDRAVAILRNCAQATAEGGRVLVVEMVVPPGNEPSIGKTYDLIMLANHRDGRVRTEAEFRALFASAGLTLQDVIPTPSPNCIIEGVRGP